MVALRTLAMTTTSRPARPQKAESSDPSHLAPPPGTTLLHPRLGTSRDKTSTEGYFRNTNSTVLELRETWQRRRAEKPREGKSGKKNNVPVLKVRPKCTLVNC